MIAVKQSKERCEYTEIVKLLEALNVGRQLATRTVVEWFGTLSFDKQTEALTKMHQAYDESRSAKRAELESQIAALGFDIPKKRGRPKSVGNRSKKRLVKAKYRDPKTNDTWSGRGRMARWLKVKQDAGEKIDRYLL